MVKNSWLRNKLELFAKWIVLALSVVLFLGAGYFFIRYWYERSFLISRYESKMHTIANERKNEIIAALVDQQNQSHTLAANPEFVSYFNELNNSFNSQTITEEYKKREAKLDQFFNQYKTIFNYRDILLIQLDGTIFYTNKIDIIGPRNLLKSELSGGILAQSFERVLLTLTPDVSDFGISLVAREPALYICEPVFYNDRVIGVVAIWIDENIFYKLIQNYNGLGKTGDIFVTKDLGERVLFVAPSRLYQNVAFKKITNPDKFALTPARRATLGYEGQGLVVDNFGLKVIAAWLFVPQVNWGLTAGIQYSEVAQSLYHSEMFLEVFLILLLLILVGLFFQFRHTYFIRRLSRKIFSREAFQCILWLAFMIGMALSVFLIWKYKYSYKKIFNQTKELAQAKVHAQAILINQYIKEIEKVAQMIAQDLQTGALNKEYIGMRIDRELKDLPNVTRIMIAYAPFAFDPQKRLYGVQAWRNNSQIETGLLTDDYMIPGSDENPLIGWYDKAIKQGAFWSEPFFDSENKKQEVLYVLPFFQDDNKEPAGVIAIVYQLDKIIAQVSSIEIGKTGYIVIISAEGKFVYHPLKQYVKNKVSFADIIRDQNNQEIKDIADQMRKGKSGFGSFFEHNGETQHWIWFEAIPTIKWTVAALFSDESLDLPYNTMHQQRIWILVTIVISLLFLAMLLSHVYRGSLVNWKEFAVFSSFLFASALGIFWYQMYTGSYHLLSDSTIVRDQTGLDKFVEFLDLDAVQRNEKRPIVVPTGIILNTLAFPESDKVAISGYVWQKVKKGTEIVTGVRFPEAAKIEINEVLRKEEEDHQIIGWNISASFLQKHPYSWFPFDRIHVDIVLASADFENNVVLVPDFDGYQSLDIDPLPGITNKINVPGFNLEKSFFSFATLPIYDEVGLENLRKVTEKVRLHYNIILDRRLTNPFIIFLLPLLVILFSIYAVFLVTFRVRSRFDVFTSLGAYTGIFFSLVLVHQTLRAQYPAGELLYIEYFFFFTYVTILLLILHALILRVGHFREFIDTKISPYLRILFWPIQLGLWFLITMIVFYVLR